MPGATSPPFSGTLNGMLVGHTTSHEHTLSTDIDWVTTQNPRDVNVLALWARDPNGFSAANFLASDFSESDNKERGAVGYGNISDSSPYSRVVFLSSSDLNGAPPYAPTTLIPIRLIQYGNAGGGIGDYCPVELDEDGNLSLWAGLWASKTLSVRVTQDGQVGIGSSTFGTERFKVAKAGDAVYTRFYTDGDSAAINVTAAPQLLAHFNATSVTRAWSIGSAAIGQPVGEDFVLNTYNGSAWGEMLRVANSSGNTTIAGSLAVGGGDAVVKFLATTAPIDYGEIAAGGNVSNDIMLTGAVAGDATFLGLPASAAVPGLVWVASVVGGNNVRLRVENVSGIPITLSSETYRVGVIRF